MLIFRPNQGSSVQYVNITLNIPVTTTAQSTSALDVITYGQAIDTAKLYANKANETFNTPITVANPVNNTDTVTRKFLFDTIFPATKAYVTPILDQYTNNDGGTFTGPVSRASDPYNLNNAPTNDNTAITNKFANDKLNQAVSSASATNAVVTGQIYEIYGTTTPPGYLKCNGASVSKTTYSDLYNAIGDQFIFSIIKSVGIPWQSQYGFNSSTQNDITGWTSTNSLTSGVTDAASLITKGYIYILGGYNGNSVLNTIQRASFDANGVLSSTWTSVDTLPASIGSMGHIATKDRFYLIGGAGSSGALSTVYSAPINADGSLGSFREETPLPDERYHSVCFVVKDKLYVISGYTNNGIVNTVYRTTVNNDGTLSSWETLPNFPINFYLGKPFLIGNRIYIFGAYDGNSNSRIYYTTYDSNGDIDTWTYVANMPNNITSPALVCTDNYIFSIGGCDMNNSKYTNIAYRAPISVDGSIGSWTKMSDGPITGDHTQPAIAGNKIYLIGGYNGNYLNTVYSADFASGITDYTQYYTEQLSASSSPVKESAGVPWQSQCGFNPSTQNDITGWASTNSLVTATTSAASLVTKNYMYILGGVGPDGALNTIQRASFDSDGNLTSDWSNVGTLPAAMGGMGYIATKGRFYLLGASSSSVYSAPINSDGTLGDFRSETSLPAAMRTSICFVIKDKLYAIGGNNNNSVYRTTVNNDGTLGSWETLSNFPINVVNGKPMLIKNRIYIFWASPDSNDNVSEIYYATYDSNGNIGSWYQYSSMPNSITDSAIVCTDNYVFSIAGYDNANIKYTNASYRAPISDNGNIGTWTQITDAPVTVIYAQSVIVGNRIYFIAGHNGKASNIVYSAAFTSGITDYSIFYNGPTPSSTFNLPDLPSTPYNAYYIKT